MQHPTPHQHSHFTPNQPQHQQGVPYYLSTGTNTLSVNPSEQIAADNITINPDESSEEIQR